jgi:hypothetical protein
MKSTRPLNNSAWNQEILDESVTKKETLGCLRITEDGRKFRYAKAGEALSPGKMGQLVDAEANHIKQAAPVAAIGAVRIGLTVGNTAVTADQYADGMLQVYDGTTTGLGMQYEIESNTACAGNGVTYVTLKQPLKYALTAADTYSLIVNPWSSVTQNASLVHGSGGVVPRPVTSAYYFWLQTGGLACCLNGGGSALGAGLVVSGTEGALKTQPDGALDSAPVAYAVAFAGVDTKYNPVMLTID